MSAFPPKISSARKTGAGITPNSCSATSAAASRASAFPRRGCGRLKELAALATRGDTPLIDDERFRMKIAAIEVELKALEMTQLRVLSRERDGRSTKPDPASSILKIKGSELQQAISELLLEVAGPYALPDQMPHDDTERWNEPPVGPDWAATLAPHYFQLAQGVDLWRIERDPEKHHRQGDPGAVMDFDLSEEQRLLQESVSRMLAGAYDSEKRKRYAAEPAGFSRSLWRTYAELGLLGLRFDEAHGGIGGGAVETMIVMECFGRVLALEPYLASIVLGGGLDTAGRRRRPAIGAVAQNRLGRNTSCFRACRAAIAL
jgi:alkylation response protein AidB-like acyl-CoA dehydrogenase